MKQVLTIVVHYFDESAAKNVDSLLDAVEVEDASGLGISNTA